MLDTSDAELLEEIRETWQNLVRERDHWQEVATLRERTIGQLLDERDETRRWAARLYRAARHAKKAVWLQAQAEASGGGQIPPLLRQAYSALAEALWEQKEE